MTTIKSVRLKFSKLLGETAKAIHFYLYDDSMHWIPKKLCRKLVVNKKLGGHVCIPTFWYEKMMDEKPTMDIADTVVIHHTPVKADKSTIYYETSLFRKPKESHR